MVGLVLLIWHIFAEGSHRTAPCSTSTLCWRSWTFLQMATPGRLQPANVTRSSASAYPSRRTPALCCRCQASSQSVAAASLCKETNSQRSARSPQDATMMRTYRRSRQTTWWLYRSCCNTKSMLLTSMQVYLSTNLGLKRTVT